MLARIFFQFLQTSIIYVNDSWPNSEVLPADGNENDTEIPDALSSLTICFVGELEIVLIESRLEFVWQFGMFGINICANISPRGRHEKFTATTFLFKFYSSLILYGFSFTLKGSFLALLIFLSVAGNILVCIAIYTERSLRRIGNLFLASLAIADLFVASLVMTFAGVNDILGEFIDLLY